MIKKNKKRASSNEPTGNGTVRFEDKALLISSIKYQISSIKYQVSDTISYTSDFMNSFISATAAFASLYNLYCARVLT